MHKRRQLLASLAALAAVVPRFGYAQPVRREWTISLVSFGTKQENAVLEETLPLRMKALGAAHDHAVVFKSNYADRDPARLESLAREIVASKPDVVIAVGTTTTRAIAKLTTTIPIVAFSADPVRDGFAKSYAHPGGNITGFTGTLLVAAPKSVEILKRLVPTVKGFTVLIVASVGAESTLYYMGNAARALGLEMRQVRVASEGDVRKALEALRPAAGSWGVSGGTLPMAPAEVARVAIECKVPLIGVDTSDVEGGALFSYYAGFQDGDKQAASVVESILQGRAPADIPFRLPETHELVINRRTARALGIAIPGDLEMMTTRFVD